jgi:fatty acid desaturase
MEKSFEKAEELASSVKEYLDIRLDAVKLTVAEKTSAVIANVLAGIAVALVFFFFMVMASVALAFVLGNWMGRTWAGFLVVAALYLLLGIIVWVARVKLIRLPFMNALIKQMFKYDEEDS